MTTNITKIALRAVLTLLLLTIASVQARAESIDLMGRIFNTPISQEELNSINTVFPEYGGLDESLLNPGAGLNLYFYQQATVTFTFIDEGAGFKNSVGYFLFDDDHRILSEHLIFSNASEKYGGGTLKPGDSVVLGLFDEGTHLGFWLRSNGYNDPNGPIFYSLEEKNTDGKNHFALWVNQDAGKIVYGIEDIINLGDRDYNDILFTVTTDPFNATQHGGGSSTPEPPTILLLGGSLVGIGGWYLRRRRHLF